VDESRNHSLFVTFNKKFKGVSLEVSTDWCVTSNCIVLFPIKLCWNSESKKEKKVVVSGNKRRRKKKKTKEEGYRMSM
jgi:hypothetical protein